MEEKTGLMCCFQEKKEGGSDTCAHRGWGSGGGRCMRAQGVGGRAHKKLWWGEAGTESGAKAAGSLFLFVFCGGVLAP